MNYFVGDVVPKIESESTEEEGGLPAIQETEESDLSQLEMEDHSTQDSDLAAEDNTGSQSQSQPTHVVSRHNVESNSS